MPAAQAAAVCRVAGFPVRRLTREEALADLVATGAGSGQRLVFFANSNFINQCGALRDRLASPSVWLLNDGVAMDVAARILHGRAFPENLNGTDFTPALLERAASAWGRPPRVFFLGGAPGVAERAGTALAGRGVEVVGTLDGFAGASDNERVLKAMEASGAEIVLVAMGNPRQERWLLDHHHRLSATLLVGVGALFDFLAQEKPRAPRWLRRLRLEWLYRLMLEPRRLAKRYTLEMVVFFWRAWQR